MVGVGVYVKCLCELSDQPSRFPWNRCGTFIAKTWKVQANCYGLVTVECKYIIRHWKIQLGKRKDPNKARMFRTKEGHGFACIQVFLEGC